MHERFSKWVLGVEGGISGYMIGEEILKKMRSRTEKRACDFEIKAKEEVEEIWLENVGEK